MSARRLAVVAAVGFSIGLLWTAAPSAQANRRSIYASVLDKEGAPVLNLGPADFVVREDNRTREILSVEPATAPMQVALLVDNSGRSRNYRHMEVARKAALGPVLSRIDSRLVYYAGCNKRVGRNA